MANNVPNLDALSSFFMPAAEAGELTGFAQNNQIPAVAERNTGTTAKSMMGFQNGSGINFQTLDAATPCVYMPAVLVVMSVPLMYITAGGQPTPMAYMIKDLVENHTRSATGFEFGYSNEPQQAGVGMDGQNYQVPGKTTRSQPTPSFMWPELQGNLVFNIIQKWMFDINHPDTNAACAQAIYPGAWTMSAYSMSVLLIQYDQTMRPDHIIDGVYYTNMWPLGTGDIGYERVLGSTKHPERNVSFTCIVQHNEMTKALAVAVAEQLQLHKHNYNIAPTQRTQIQKAISSYGYYQEHVERRNWVDDAAKAGIQKQDITTSSAQVANAAWMDPQNTAYAGESPAPSTFLGNTNTPWYEN